MILSKYSNEELRQIILEGLKKNRISELYGLSANEMADSFMAYTPLARQIIVDWYSMVKPTKNKMNWIMKTGFEHRFFYIGGTDALVALMLLGRRVDNDRCTNISKTDMERLNQGSVPQGNSQILGRTSFFERYGLKSKDVNKNWNELY